MSKTKKTVGVVFAVVIGVVFIYLGFKDYRSSKRLAAEGKAVAAQVVDSDKVYRRKGRVSHYLTVAFRTTDGQQFSERVKVDRDAFEAGSSSGTVKVWYLPSNPTVFQVGDKVETKFGNIVFGALIFVGGLVWPFFKRSSSEEEAATAAVQKNEVQKNDEQDQQAA